MIVLDVNLLLFAQNEDAPEHSRAARWLEEVWRSREPIGLPWVTIWAFFRLSTSRHILPRPNTPRQARSVIEEWLALPDVSIPEAGPRHIEILERLMTSHSVSGSRTTDVVLAALALEHNAQLASADREFERFAELKWINPLA